MAHGKVVHISDDLHRKASAFCKKHKIKMGKWVEDIIIISMEAAKEVEKENKR